MTRVPLRTLSVAAVALLLGACAAAPEDDSTEAPAEAGGQAAPTDDESEPWQQLPAPDHTLANFIPGATPDYCFDRSSQPYTAVVDAHIHPKPFGGPAMEVEDLWGIYDRMGVRFMNAFGIGQVLELEANCNYYLDCPGVAAVPGVKNDFLNAMDVANLDPETLHVTLSMTFMDLAHPEDIIETIELYDREFPGMFSWSGELNIIKQALLPNEHEPATMESIDAWAPFMAVLEERGIPVTFHADLGNNADPTQFLPLIEHAISSYPDNKIVWAHMGLSKELSTMSPEQHVRIVSGLLDQYPHLMVDISWDVLYNEYHEWGDVYLPFLNEYSTRILPGTDFVAAGYKEPEQYAHELEVTSRALRRLDDEAFRNIALGQNYFEFLGIDFEAPPLCGVAGS